MARLLLCLSLVLVLGAAHAPDDDLDAFWAEAARTVEEGDFEGYAALYHDDAVLVNAISGESHPISAALEKWKPGFEATRAGRMEADVAFRFTQRLRDESTAHETGIFRYTEHPEGGAPRTAYIHFESLMVRGEDGWKWVMEYQKSQATEEEWDAAG